MGEELTTIGKIIRHQGNKGEVRVAPLTDFIERFEELDSLYLIKNRIKKEVFVEDMWYHKDFVILKFKGFDEIGIAIEHKGFFLKVKDEDKVDLPEATYYIDDIVGIQVYTDQGEDLGILAEVLETGANDVYVVKNANKEVLLPAIKDVVLSVDMEKREMIVKMIPGLR
ncbi:ribosome maturation factor RimM [Halonatronum saccharophilum]|uniref:ribosome maturation factor RimM n=1 Tax=Halonatronum saccharophilum TaxID=150060 RepID=UPI000483A606|nr:ribosome maturation factor RimM [Halonatronum saccharophilum]